VKQEEILREKKEKLEVPRLKFAKGALEPVLSEENVDFHYGVLTKAYFEKYNKTGDEFQYAGAFLHTILWEQYTEKRDWGIQPKTKEFIEKHFKTIDAFKEEMKKEALAIRGSGWVYLSKSGKIKTIKNHEVKKDILLLIDVWEHSWSFGQKNPNKEKYLKNIWSIMNWLAIEARFTTIG
jgi:superoxide dismutase, Fe-Mn family